MTLSRPGTAARHLQDVALEYLREKEDRGEIPTSAYAFPVAGLGGNCRGFLETVVAGLLRDPNTRVLYIGDADDCGNAIEAHTRRVLERATGREFGPDTWERLAITPGQVEGLRRRGVEPIQKRDERYGDGNPHEAFEAEALGQAEIERIVRERLDQLLPEPLERVHERAAEQREMVLKALAAAIGSIGGHHDERK
jgi:hypothetical protein